MRLLSLISLAFVPSLAVAQLRTADQSHVWTGLLGDYRVTDRVALYQEVWLRRGEEGAVWQQRHFVQGATLTLGHGWRVAAGHGFIRTSAYGELPAAPSDEQRLWAHVTYAHETGRLRWTHRTRLERRWIDDDASTLHTARWRQQLRLVYPLTAKAYAHAQGENFVRLAPSAQRGDLEQTRAWLGAGYPVARATNLELSYLQQRVRRATARERNHTLVLNVRATWPLR
jgi:hypothetical protein